MLDNMKAQASKTVKILITIAHSVELIICDFVKNSRFFVCFSPLEFGVCELQLNNKKH